MGITNLVKNITGKARKEAKVLKGDESKDKIYYSRRAFETEQEAYYAFIKATEKLLNVYSWNNVSAITKSTFSLYDPAANKTKATKVGKGYYMKIELPPPGPTSWVRVEEVTTLENSCQFVVRPCKDPTHPDHSQHAPDHFFTRDATSTFRVTLNGKVLSAYEIGRDEKINNSSELKNEDALLNTLTSEGGWIFFQKYQWKALTDYIVGI